MTDLKLPRTDALPFIADPVEKHIREALFLLGIDVESQHFARTPARVTKVLRAYIQPVDLNEVLSAGFEDDDLADDDKHEKTLVVQTGINFMGLCAHHLLPFLGSAAIGYLPDARVVGISKLTRLVYAAGHMAPSTQEHITNLVADALYNPKGSIKPKGVAVLTSSFHGCMASRGVEAPVATRTLTSALRGVFHDNPALEGKFTDMAMPGLK